MQSNPYSELIISSIRNGHFDPRHYDAILTNNGLKLYPIIIISWKGKENLNKVEIFLSNSCSYKPLTNYKLNVRSHNLCLNLLSQIHILKPWWIRNLDIETHKRIKVNGDIYIGIGLIPLEMIKKLKEEKRKIRGIFNGDKSYFHISDPDCLEHLGKDCKCNISPKSMLTEFSRQCNLIFHENTRRILDLKVYRQSTTYENNIKKYLQVMNSNLDVAIDNSSVMSACGIRDSRDIDFLYKGKWYFCNVDGLECHNISFGIDLDQTYFQFLGVTKNELIDDPKHFFYMYGTKHILPEYVLKFKENRRINGFHREKDIRDSKLLKKWFELASSIKQSKLELQN
tara:strand:- start:1020 stop:2042 length:1023 start_codon:yes stop_codon:yes gene_type:complete